MLILWCIVGVGVTVLATQMLFRRYATSRIQTVLENVPPFGVVPAKVASGARLLSISTSDGLMLSGSFYEPKSGQPPRALVVFFPELNGNHWMAAEYCRSLLRHGFAVLAFDFRGQGNSDCQDAYRPIHWITEFEMTDVAAVFEFIESDPQLNTLPLVAFGISRGGVAALACACRYPRIRAVAADSAFGTMAMIRCFTVRFGKFIIPEWLFNVLPKWHIAITLRQAVRRSELQRGCRYIHLEHEAALLSDTPVLLISGTRDSYVTPQTATSLAQDFGECSTLWMVEGAKHNMARRVAPDKYDLRILAHFEPFALPTSERQLTAQLVDT